MFVYNFYSKECGGCWADFQINFSLFSIEVNELNPFDTHTHTLYFWFGFTMEWIWHSLLYDSIEISFVPTRTIESNGKYNYYLMMCWCGYTLNWYYYSGMSTIKHSSLNAIAKYYMCVSHLYRCGCMIDQQYSSTVIRFDWIQWNSFHTFN